MHCHCLLTVPKGTTEVCLFFLTELGTFIYLQCVCRSHPEMVSAYKMYSPFFLKCGRSEWAPASSVLPTVPFLYREDFVLESRMCFQSWPLLAHQTGLTSLVHVVVYSRQTLSH